MSINTFMKREPTSEEKELLEIRKQEEDFYKDKAQKLSGGDLLIIDLAKKFDAYKARQSKKFYSSLGKKNIQEHANYKYFSKFAHLVRTSNINPDLYIEAQFYFANKKSVPCKPAWLATDLALTRYEAFVKMRNEVNEAIIETVSYTDQLRESLKQSIMFMTKKSIELKIDNLFEYKKPNALMPESYIWILNGSVTKPYLSISKSYHQFYQGLDPDIKSDFPDVAELGKIRKIIILNKDLHVFCKSIIPQDCNF